MERKNMFILNLGSDESDYECPELEVRRISAALAKEKQELDALYEKKISKMLAGAIGLSLARVFGFIIGTFLFVIGFYLFSEGGTSIAIPLMIAAVICIGVSVVLSIVKKGKEKSESDEDEALDERFDRLNRACADYLGVPEDAKEIDVFTKLINERNYDGVEFPEYASEILRVFSEDGKLCLFFYDRIYGIPIDSITEITLVNKRVVFDGWNKEESYDSEEYAEYRITETKGGNLEIGAFYSVRFSYGGVDYELVIPPYDESPILDITKSA